MNHKYFGPIQLDPAKINILGGVVTLGGDVVPATNTLTNTKTNMNRTKMKLRVDQVTQQHVRLTVFMGEEGCTLANCGTLTMDHPQYQLFAVAPLLAQDQMQHHFVTEVEEDKWKEYHDINE